MYFALFILLLLVLICMIFSRFRKRKIICRIRCMDMCTKCALLGELAGPLGYIYHCGCGFFSSAKDAWQKSAGYTWLYDYMAPRFQMVFDALPVYFDYQGRTWLIEFWKGQYGINAGAEIGIYHADRILSKTEYRTALFNAANENEMLYLTLCLRGRNGICMKHSDIHWWLTMFLPGCFSAPGNLCLTADICFPDTEMLEAFLEGLYQAGYTDKDITIHDLFLSFTFDACGHENYNLITRFYRHLSQIVNQFFCRLYLWVTRPFTYTEDRILYLYYYLPAVFRRLLRFRRFHKKCHRNNGSIPPGYDQRRGCL